MVYYEMLMLLAPDITTVNFDLIKSEISEIISSNEGIIHNYDKWGKYLLAYKIEKHAYGIYVLIRFSSNSKKGSDVILSKIKDLCTLKFNNSVMRYVFVKLGNNMNESYCKPDSLEEAPRREKTYDIDEMISRKNRYQKRNTDQEERNFDGAVLDNTLLNTDNKIAKEEFSEHI